ncbi:hypothetical protein SDC9_162393 [bioreactor metagenome]|uniref:Uncharacterized protein n=1 Tax=bioreactor metagenome TaxID=1076179 RepID=A0A645FS96_9ZZZZ
MANVYPKKYDKSANVCSLHPSGFFLFAMMYLTMIFRVRPAMRYLKQEPKLRRDNDVKAKRAHCAAAAADDGADFTGLRPGDGRKQLEPTTCGFRYGRISAFTFFGGEFNIQVAGYRAGT